MIQQVREGLDQSLQGLAGEDLARTVDQFLDRSPSAGKAEAGKVKDGKEPAKPAAGKAEQAIDLVVLVYPRELDKAAVRSLFDESIRACASDAAAARGRRGAALRPPPGSSRGPLGPDRRGPDRAGRGQARSRRRGAREARSGPRASRRWSRLPPGARANARQRAEAQRLIPLWFVARACRQSSALKDRGDRLAAIALEAARRQSDNRWTLAMLREQGQQALDRGDRQAAEASWGLMLDAILVGDKKKGDRKPNPPAVPAPAAPARPAAPPTRYRSAARRLRCRSPPAPPAAVPPRPAARRPRPPVAGNVPLLTLDRFEQAMQVAKLAAEHDLTALAARAVLESLKGGPPVVVAPSPNSRRSRVYIRRNGVLVQDEPPDQIVPRVVARLVELEALWQRKARPADRVYETLRQVVMPEARPAEIFLYAQPIGPAQALRPRSVGAMLAAWAVKADQVDDLARKIDARKSQPLAQLAGRRPPGPARPGRTPRRRPERRARGPRRAAEEGHAPHDRRPRPPRRTPGPGPRRDSQGRPRSPRGRRPRLRGP